MNKLKCTQALTGKNKANKADTILKKQYPINNSLNQLMPLIFNIRHAILPHVLKTTKCESHDNKTTNIIGKQN